MVTSVVMVNFVIMNSVCNGQHFHVVNRLEQVSH